MTNTTNIPQVIDQLIEVIQNGGGLIDWVQAERFEQITGIKQSSLRGNMRCGQKVLSGLSLMTVASIIVLRGITIGQVSKQQIAAHRRHRQKRHHPYLVDVAQKETLANA